MAENQDFCKRHEELREILCKQLQLLAEQSIGCNPYELAELSEQMVSIYSVLCW